MIDWNLVGGIALGTAVGACPWVLIVWLLWKMWRDTWGDNK